MDNADSAVPFRLLSYNIHKGFNANNGTFVLKQIKQSIRIVHADLVFLQEVQGHHDQRGRIEDWPTAAQFEYLADEVWPHHCYGKNAVYSLGHHGNAILSKYPILSWENIDISTNKFEQRGLLHAVIDYPGGGAHLHAMCVHLGLFESARQRQIQNMISRVHARVPPEAHLIIAGDFNDWRLKAEGPITEKLGMIECYRHTHQEHARTFPSWFPLMKLDRIYVKNLGPVSAKNLGGPPWKELSDHTALFAEVRLDPVP